MVRYGLLARGLAVVGAIPARYGRRSARLAAGTKARLVGGRWSRWRTPGGG